MGNVIALQRLGIFIRQKCPFFDFSADNGNLVEVDHVFIFPQIGGICPHMDPWKTDSQILIEGVAHLGDHRLDEIGPGSPFLDFTRKARPCFKDNGEC